MDSSRVPFVLVILAAVLASLFQLPRSGRPDSGQSNSDPSAESQAAGTLKKKFLAKEEDPWKGLAEVVSSYFGSEETGSSPKAQVTSLATAAGGLETMIVLVSDPVDSGLATDFDQAIAAIQEAYADSGFILDRFWLPWTGKAKERHFYRHIPGLLLFRHFKSQNLVAVLVVGEVPRQGIHPAAFREALSLVQGWEKTVSIVGPYFSDSADSLARALKSQPQHLPVRLVTGSAMSNKLTDMFRDLQGVEFGQSIVDEYELQRRAVEFFERLGWETERVALLTEADTAFGQLFLTEANREHFLLIRFPNGISGIRTAWEHDKRSPGGEQIAGGVEIPKTTLDVTLADRDQPVHLLPELGTFTSASRDLAISNLLAVIGARRIDYIGILATDPRDTLFLAERIRRLAPSKVLFVVDNHLLFTHPNSSAVMNGTIALSGYPLFTEDWRWRTELGGPEGKYLRQFTSSIHQGIYRAVLALRRPGPLPRKRDQLAWMSIIGNGSLWPIASMDKKLTGCECTKSIMSKPPAEEANREGLSHRTGTKLVWFALGLCLLALVLIQLGDVPRHVHAETWLPRFVAPAVLWLNGVILAVLGSLPHRRLGVRFDIYADWKLVAVGVLLVVLSGLLARFSTGPGRKRWLLSSAVFLITGIFFFPLVDWILCTLWMPGGAEHFHRRVFIFSSGFSPLVSLAWIGGSLYLWSLAELRRHRMKLRQKICWPLDDNKNYDERLDECVHGWLPPTRVWLWMVLVPAGLALLLALLPLRPLAETGTYGHVFAVLLGLTLFLGALSFCRFLRTWLVLNRILKRTALPHPPAGLDKELACLLAWKPMKSFGWQIPNFGATTILAIDVLGDLDRAGMLWNTNVSAGDIRNELELAMNAAGDNNFEEEVQHREKMQNKLHEASLELARKDVGAAPAVERFHALRLVSYVRYMFAHLRAFLMTTLACGFPLLAAASSYAYEPNEYVTNGIWSLLLLAVLVALWAFFQMDRNELLSAIGQTTPGQVTLNRELVLGTLTYGVVPLLGLIVAQFPQAGRYFVSLINPVLRALGSGG